MLIRNCSLAWADPVCFNLSKNGRWHEICKKKTHNDFALWHLGSCVPLDVVRPISFYESIFVSHLYYPRAISALFSGCLICIKGMDLPCALMYFRPRRWQKVTSDMWFNQAHHYTAYAQSLKRTIIPPPHDSSQYITASSDVPPRLQEALSVTHTHTSARTHTHIHTNIHTRMHTHTQALTHTYTHTRAKTHKRTFLLLCKIIVLAIEAQGNCMLDWCFYSGKWSIFTKKWNARETQSNQYTPVSTGTWHNKMKLHCQVCK